MWNKTIDVKICGDCKIKFPKTEEYFFKRVINQTLKTGEVKTYYCFKSKCKKCHGLQGNNIRIKKRCEEMNCNVLDYRENWKKQYYETRTLFKEFKEYALDTRKRMYKYKNEGKDVSTYENYKKLGRLKQSKNKRKYDYGNTDFVPKEKLSKSGIVNLTDAYIALTLKAKVKEVPKEMIEFKRLTIQLKRELQNN